MSRHPERTDSAGSSWRRFAHRHGWRAYALPVLVVVTLLAMFTTKTTPNTVRDVITGNDRPADTVSSSPPVAASRGQLKTDVPTAGSMNEALPSAALPPGKDYTRHGNGTYSTIPGTSGVIGTRGPIMRFSIEVENGIEGIDLAQFADTVMKTLSDKRSWTAGKDVRLQRVQEGAVNFHVTLVSSMTVRGLCGYELEVETSCFAPDQDNRVVLNNARWVRGDVAYIADLAAYHEYMVNHEVGHALGHGHIMDCLPNGLAPVMMQQTITLKSNNGTLCQPNPWPFP